MDEYAQTYLHLPTTAFHSDEWKVHAAQYSVRIPSSTKLSSTTQVPDNLDDWLNEVIDKAKDIGVSLLIFPWADSLIRGLEKRYRKDPSAPHAHLLLGRCPPGVIDFVRGSERAAVLATLQSAKRLAEAGSVCTGRLCATLDSLAGQTAEPEIANRIRYVIDPVSLATHPTKKKARGRLGWELDRQYALLIGDLSERKRATEVVRSWQTIYAKTGITLVLAGEVDQSVPQLPEMVRELGSLFPGSIIADFSYSSQERFVEYIAAADVVLCTFKQGTYMPSGVAGLAAVLGAPIFVEGNRYIEKLVSGSSFGTIGHIGAEDASELLEVAIAMPVPQIEHDVGYDAFINQWMGDCLSVGNLLNNRRV
ncbi:MAG TPA: hypothetical protein VLF60_03070 [Candidatus Saccharimonadales bacterium]|nr:hypothetical protein [Candidatus Saccharimonadales bacterium]